MWVISGNLISKVLCNFTLYIHFIYSLMQAAAGKLESNYDRKGKEN